MECRGVWAFRQASLAAKAYNSPSRAICSGRKCPHVLFCTLRYFRLSNHFIWTVLRLRWIGQLARALPNRKNKKKLKIHVLLCTLGFSAFSFLLLFSGSIKLAGDCEACWKACYSNAKKRFVSNLFFFVGKSAKRFIFKQRLGEKIYVRCREIAKDARRWRADRS